mmetsp:Transcript_31891/g.70470  ORF Transcript_31891/g.70470 Transcript_31891/m.70470 type:complete len:95 (-) Transcript_31891:82-366(-)|eukprot:1887669-Amphidinium_carterae.1
MVQRDTRRRALVWQVLNSTTCAVASQRDSVVRALQSSALLLKQEAAKESLVPAAESLLGLLAPGGLGLASLLALLLFRQQWLLARKSSAILERS